MKAIRILTLLTALFSGCALAADSAPVTSAVSLTGEKAVAQLKESGQYDSLAAAYEAARHAVRADEAEPDGVLHAQNPGHGLSASFDRHGLHLSVQRHGSEGERLTTRWRLDSVGREGAVEKVPAGDALRRDGQRAEIVRAGLGLTEWFVNRPSGLEHGFTLERRPAGEGALRLNIAIEGDLSPVPGADGQRIELHDAAGAKVLDYDKLRVWDAAGQELPARMEQAAAGGLRLRVDDAGARYPLTVDPTFTQQAYLKPGTVGTTQAGDQFGLSVAVSGETVVVGAVSEDSSTTGINSTPNESAGDAGAAYVFVRSGNTWTQQAYLKASQVTAGDNFGYSVAVAGDTLVVGALNEDSSTTGTTSTPNESAASAGAAYVFVRRSTTWSQQAYLKASNPNSSDLFGWSVGVDGDTVAVGALNEDSNATGVNGDQSDNAAENSGAVYVFARSGTIWTQQAYLKPAAFGTTQAGDQFGASVALSGNTVVVGAQSEDSSTPGINSTPDESATDAGAAYVFVRSGTAWSQQAYLKPAAFGTTQAGDRFGASVAVSADTVVVGALREDSSTTGSNSTANESAAEAGAAYVFVRSGTTWAQQAYLKPAAFGTTQARDQFGISVAVSGDTVVVGANLEDSSTTGIDSTPNESAADAGAAYVFVRSGSTWSQQAYLKASQVTVVDIFGYSVAASGDTVVLGAPLEASSTTGINSTPNESAAGAGAAYVFTLIPDPTLTSVSPSTGSTAGGTLVTLTGTNFTGATGVTFGGTAATSVAVVNATTITCTTPAGTAGAKSVQVTTPGGTNAANTLFTYVAPPTLTSLSPNRGTTAGGTVVTLTGTNFTGATGVTFGGTAATAVNVVNATSITCTTPAGTAGARSVLVTTPGGTNAANTLFTYFTPPPPGISVIFTDNGTTTTASFSGNLNTSFFPVPDSLAINQFTAYIRPEVGWFGIGGSVTRWASSVVFTRSSGGAGNALGYGSGAGGSAAPITGSGQPFLFIPANGRLELPANYVSGAQISGGATYPGVTVAGLGIVNTEYTLPGNQKITILNGNPPPPSPPTLTSLSPNRGTTAGGTVVTLTGTNFTGATGVTFGGTAATSLTVNSATTITCTTPAGTAGARSVLVTTPGGTNAANTLFTYAAPPPTLVINTASNPTGTPNTSTDELAYASFVSTTDLLHGIVGTGGSWNTAVPSASPNGLNDGTHGVDGGSLTGVAFANDGNSSFRTFDLGGGPDGLGFNITEIQSIAAWRDAGFANQRYEVYVSLVGDSAFTLLTTVNYQPFMATGGAATKVNIVGSTPGAFIATGIDAIRFNILDTTSSPAGGVVMREIDVFGSAVLSEPFRITAFSYNRTARTVDLTWLSEPAVNYTIETSVNGQTWTTLGAPVPGAQGAATTTVTGRPLQPPYTDRLLLRVRRP